MAKRAISQLTKLFDHKCGVSQRIASKKFKCSQSLISKTLKTKTSMKKRKQMKIPSRTESQRAKNRRLCGQLYKNYKDFIWVLDDESYFTSFRFIIYLCEEWTSHLVCVFSDRCF